MNPYTEDFFDSLLAGSRRSAQLVVPIVMELVRPKRVVDVGCGLGTWLAVFREHGAEEVLGIDGDYVDPQRLEIAPHEFLACDLSRPMPVGRRFDLAVCLEVAEHLPEGSADVFVAFLASLAPVVLFSAAVPNQGGTNHINEQWPDYWTARFAVRGYRLCDSIRDRIWDNPDVEWWYAQNILLFSRQPMPAPAEPPVVAAKPGWRGLSRVHPRLYTSTIEYLRRHTRDREAEIEQTRAELASALNRNRSELAAAADRLERARAEAARARAELGALKTEFKRRRAKWEVERGAFASLRKRACGVAAEAAALRDSRLMRLARWLRGDEDLWERVPAKSAALRRDAIKYGFRRNGHALRQSPNLQRGGIVYPFPVRVNGARGVALQVAVAVPGCGGVIGAELISPSNQVVTRGTLSLDLVADHRPTVIQFGPTDVGGDGWGLRVFVADSPSPVRILEFQRLRLPIPRSLVRQPFCSVVV